MPGEVKDPTQAGGKCVTCSGLNNSREKDNSCVSPSLGLSHRGSTLVNIELSFRNKQFGNMRATQFFISWSLDRSSYDINGT